MVKTECGQWDNRVMIYQRNTRKTSWLAIKENFEKEWLSTTLMGSGLPYIECEGMGRKGGHLLVSNDGGLGYSNQSFHWKQLEKKPGWRTVVTVSGCYKPHPYKMVNSVVCVLTVPLTCWVVCISFLVSLWASLFPETQRYWNWQINNQTMASKCSSKKKSHNSFHFKLWAGND